MQPSIVPCGSYDIVVGANLLSTDYVANDLLQLLPSTATFVVLTDTNVLPLYAEPLTTNLRTQIASSDSPNRRVILHAIAPGELSKSRATKAYLEDHVLFKNRCHRDTCVIAVGGGVIGDLSGFVASTYMRGVPFVQVPTSLLACVDSSIGGKTGIDVEHIGKNLLGTFHMPQKVYIDLDVLKTLPMRELCNGMAEVIKAGCISDSKLFELCEAHADQVLSLSDFSILQEIVSRAVKVKAEVVTEDTKEHGRRAILNFGHSVGHGIEALLQPHYLHGECVSIGMVKEAEISRGMGKCSSATVGRMLRVLQAYKLPVKVPQNVITNDVLVKMEVDKKNSGGVKKIILLEQIGRVASNPFTRAVNDEQIALAVEKQVTMVPGLCANGSIRVPGSKSISNRVLLMAALGEGTCRISGLLHSDDTQVMMTALSKLGAGFSWEDSEKHGSVLVVEGTGGQFDGSKLTTSDQREMYLSNAGTAARFLTTAMTLVKNCGDDVVVTGNYRMQERPIKPLVDALIENGCGMTYVKNEGFPPVAVKGAGLKGGKMTLEAKVSSQYVSSVLISAPYADEPVLLQLDEENPTSLPYILMTTQLMGQFGVDVEVLAPNQFRVPKTCYKNPSFVEVEVDASSATYPLAFAAITGGSVTVDALGNGSLQGDSNFFSLLEQMGCTTSQTETSTTVTGPQDAPLKAVDVDMGVMTDAFMTAAVLCAVADGTSNITGIANQRVKECNRIEVMVTELTKIGIECGELPDGIWIRGVNKDVSKLHKSFVQCHNDHRIAMSFAVLGSVVPNVVITDKDCTDKTYPEFWDDVQRKLGLRVSPYLETGEENQITEGETPAVFVVGMRGAGKSSLASFAAKKLGMELMDTDRELEKQLGESISSFVAKCDGDWTAFREKQKELLLSLVMNPPANTIVSCGGGVVETPEIVRALSGYRYVVLVNRHVDDIVAYLDGEGQANRPSLGDSHFNIWQRRMPLYVESSSFEFVINKGDLDLSNAGDNFARLLQVALPNHSSSFDWQRVARPDTFFLSLTYGDISDAKDIMPTLCADAHALELRVDLLNDFKDVDFVKSQVAALRRMSDLPIIFTVRSKAQGGQFPDGQENEQEMIDLLNLGLRLGCEFVDVEASLPLAARKKLVKERGHSAIISSFHSVQHAASKEELDGIFDECYLDGQCQVVKVVTKAFNGVSDVTLLNLVKDEKLAQWATPALPVITLCTTEAGKLSRVLNQTLTPVTHPKLPSSAAPGQMSVKQIWETRQQLGMIPSRQFCLFGSPISKSPSSAMHNAAFQLSNLPFEYTLHETESAADVANMLKQKDFGGASVTIPLKLDVIPLLDELSDAAKSIGAVNTLVRLDQLDGSVKWKGENTDWMGIRTPIQKRIQSHLQDKDSLVALVVGAGGTARAAVYAMQQLPQVSSVFIHNRTHGKAQGIANEFGITTLEKLEKDALESVDVVVSTVPAQADFQLPVYLLENSKTVVMDAAYLPVQTPMLKHAKEVGKELVECVYGYEMLYTQAMGQYERWHGSTKAFSVDEQVLKQACIDKIPSDMK